MINKHITISIFIALAIIFSFPADAAIIRYGGVTYEVSDKMVRDHSKLVQLILKTESMDNDERKYWFDIYPSLTAQQIQKLFDILETERKKLLALELKYQKELLKLLEENETKQTVKEESK